MGSGEEPTKFQGVKLEGSAPGDSAAKTALLIVANKKTLIYLLANAAGNDQDKNELNHWYSLKGEVPGKVSAVTQIFQKLEADQIALATADAFYMKADMELQHLNLETDKMKPLNELINILKGRTS